MPSLSRAAPPDESDEDDLQPRPVRVPTATNSSIGSLQRDIRGRFLKKSNQRLAQRAAAAAAAAQHRKATSVAPPASPRAPAPAPVRHSPRVASLIAAAGPRISFDSLGLGPFPPVQSVVTTITQVGHRPLGDVKVGPLAHAPRVWLELDRALELMPHMDEGIGERIYLHWKRRHELNGPLLPSLQSIPVVGACL